MKTLLKLSAVAAVLAIVGCAQVEFHGADGTSLKRTAFAINTKFSKLEAQNGTNRVSIEGYISDAAIVARETAAGVAEGIAKGVKK